MLNVLKKWYDKRFHDEETIVLVVMLIIAVLALYFFSSVLTPVIAALVWAFLLQGVVVQLSKFNVPHMASVTIAFLMLILLEIVTVFVLLTLVLNQFDNLIKELPQLIGLLQEWLVGLPEKYPSVVTEEQVNEWSQAMNTEIANFGQWALSYTQSNALNLVSFMVYLVLVPIFVFFFLKDKDELLNWFGSFLPHRRPILNQVWEEMNAQMANYVRGKFIEMLIVGGISFVTFVLFGLNYAALLAIAVGISVIVPYVGAFLVTIPVVFVGYIQWGWGGTFIGLFVAYTIIQVLDGNVLVPLLFSETVNLHPIAILIAIMFFGGIWGLWGVFFAIPLATLVKAILNAWPTHLDEQSLNKA